MAEPSGTLPAPGDIVAALDRVLARPEFNPRPETALDRLRAWLSAQWDEWYRALQRLFFDGVGDVIMTSWVIESIVIALVVVLLVVLARRLPSVKRRAREHDVAPASADDPTGGARAQLAAAATAAAAGRFLEAAHALYLGVVLWLSASGQLRFDDATTGEEYARALPRDGVGGPFRALLATFYPLAFGDRPATTEAYARMRAAATAMGVPE
jgi:hypothetical protein